MNQTIDYGGKPPGEKATLFYKKFFLFAAVWNIGAGLMGVVSLSFNIKTFYGVENYPADDLFKLHYYNFWLFILIMGIGFYFVSRDITRNYAMAIVGLLGKTAAVGIWLYYYFIGHATYVVLVAGAGDILLVLVFAIYLSFTMKRARVEKLLNQKI